VLDNCPVCGITWIGESIPDRLFETGHYADRAEAENAASAYGWTAENDKRFRENVVGIETAGYDGVSIWKCVCGTKIDRWTNKILDSPEP